MLAQTALEHVAPQNIIAVLLTGMGYDGAAGFAEIKKGVDGRLPNQKKRRWSMACPKNWFNARAPRWCFP